MTVNMNSSVGTKIKPIVCHRIKCKHCNEYVNKMKVQPNHFGRSLKTQSPTPNFKLNKLSIRGTEKKRKPKPKYRKQLKQTCINYTVNSRYEKRQS